MISTESGFARLEAERAEGVGEIPTGWQRHGVNHVLTFDVEDWFHLGIPNYPKCTEWASFRSIVEERTNEFLRICSEAKVKATFFVLGWIAEHHPSIVPRILSEGHEVGTHSFWHRHVTEQTEAEFLEDLHASLQVLGSQGARVLGYRAPCFSIPRESGWVYDALGRAGLRYSSSQLASTTNYAQWSQRGPYVRTTSDGKWVAELPISRVAAPAALGGLHIRYSGSGYLRILPLPVIKACMTLEARNGRGTVVYLHPRDLVSDPPRIALPLNHRVRKYVRLRGTQSKVRRLLGRYTFMSCWDHLQSSLGVRL
jgi:polysaccharide deacetylase family protein (PEP-CTERM system associated)